MSILYWPILIPFVIGLLAILIPKRPAVLHKGILIASAAALFGLTLFLFVSRPSAGTGLWHLRLDNLAALILLGTGFFGFLISLYSLRYFSEAGRIKEFGIYTLWTLGSAAGIALSDNLLMVLVFWGFLGFALYLMVNLAPGGAQAAKKTFAIVGGSDILLLFGFVLIFVRTGAWDMSGVSLRAENIHIVTYLFLVLAAFAKAGALPLHTWVPDAAETAPVPVTALLPAALDKLLGIYLLVRVATEMFSPNGLTTYFLLITGALTILVGVMMALIQHDMKRLLGYHAVSQVGYMIIGIGSGTPVGIIGGLFHMVNNAIYKSALFLSAGAVEQKTGTTDLDSLGGISRLMPVTFAVALLASLSISGLPPFSGFVSKWLIYQGLLQSFVEGRSLLVLFTFLAAVIGSALTLASFLKLLHAAFLTSAKRDMSGVREVSWPMWLPMTVLAALCVVFGVFAYQLPLPFLVGYAVPGATLADVSASGLWQPLLATGIIVTGLAAGFLAYLLFFRGRAVRRDSAFVGGENVSDTSYPAGTDFYRTIEDYRIMQILYTGARRKFFDVYDLGSRAVLAVGGALSRAHAGSLRAYLLWYLAGTVFLIWMLL